MESIRARFVNLMLLLAALILLFDLFNSLAGGYVLMAWAEVAFIPLLLITYLLFRRGLPFGYASVVGVGSVAFLSLFSLTVDGYGREAALFWTASLPIYIFFLLGAERGITWSIVITGVIALSAANAYFAWVPPIFSYDVLIQLTLGYLALSYLVYYVERLRGSYESRLDQALKEREALLKELHHRVKNNMQVMMGLLWLQADKIDEPRYRHLLLENINRLASMAMIHEHLYRTDEVEKIDMGEYLRAIVSHLESLSDHDIHTQIAPVALDMKSAMNIGIIVNEAVTNAMEHAFEPGVKGWIRVALKDLGTRVALRLEDNGRGVKTEPPEREALGMTLIRDLAEGLSGGECDIRMHKGVRIVITFDKERQDVF